MLETLRVRHIRILERVELHPSPGLNVITGPNAVGKTSLLEAVDILSRGRSYRARQLQYLLTRGRTWLRVTGQVRHGGQSLRLGIERSARGSRIRCQGAPAAGVAGLAALLPVQAMHPDSHRLIAGGPAERRRFLDWGVFHVEPEFLRAWRRYRRALHQRNAGLRRPDAELQARAWHAELSASGRRIDALRREHVEVLAPQIQASLDTLLPDANLTVAYAPGWPSEQALESVLERDLSEDIRRGHTRSGPHRAELEIRLHGQPAATVASRGQQKLIVASLLLAQMRVFKAGTGRSAVFLADDLCSELDEEHRGNLLAALQDLGSQVFVTALDAYPIDTQAWSASRVFHVKQGVVREVV